MASSKRSGSPRARNARPNSKPASTASSNAEPDTPPSTGSSNDCSPTRTNSCACSSGRRFPSTPTHPKTTSAPSSPNEKSPAEPSAKEDASPATSCSASPRPAPSSKSRSSITSAPDCKSQARKSHSSQPWSPQPQPDLQPGNLPRSPTDDRGHSRLRLSLAFQVVRN